MPTDPVQFSLMMNNRPQASLDKAQQRNNEVFAQTMQAMSMAQRSQQMAQQQQQFDITTQLRMKETDFNMKRSMAEAALAEKRFGIAEKQISLEERKADRELNRQESLKVFQDKLDTINLNDANAGSQIEQAMKGMDYESRNSAEALILAKKNRVSEDALGKLQMAAKIKRNERMAAIDSEFFPLIKNPDDEIQIQEAEALTRAKRNKLALEANDISVDKFRKEQAIKDESAEVKQDREDDRQAQKLENADDRLQYNEFMANYRAALAKRKMSEADDWKAKADAIISKSRKNTDTSSKPSLSEDKKKTPHDYAKAAILRNPSAKEAVNKRLIDAGLDPLP